MTTKSLMSGNKNVLYHDCSCGKMTVYICQNSNCSLKTGKFQCMLKFSNIKKKKKTFVRNLILPSFALIGVIKFHKKHKDFTPLFISEESGHDRTSRSYNNASVSCNEIKIHHIHCNK